MAGHKHLRENYGEKGACILKLGRKILFREKDRQSGLLRGQHPGPGQNGKNL